MMENDSTRRISRPTTTPSLGFGKKEELTHQLDLIAIGNDLSLAKIYFVYSELHNQVLHDPMTGKPVHSRHRDTLREAAKEFNGKILDGKSVIREILKHGPKQIPPNTPV